MRNLCEPAIAKYRDSAADRLYGTKDEERAYCGAFLIPYRSGMGRVYLRVIASQGEANAAEETGRWEHLSVSLSNRCPSWEEMEYIKRLFFKPEEAAFQLHPPLARYISNHDFCLHIWRPLAAAIPMPPDILVGIRV